MTGPRSSAGTVELWEAWRRSVPTGWLPWWPGPQAASAPTAGSSQSILPGWNFGTVLNITEQNSAAPATEAAILETHSYGRQLGQIADALEVLIEERKGPHDPKLAKFTEMKLSIDATKAGMADTRLRQFGEDLANLRERDDVAFAEVRERLLRMLNEDGGPAASDR